MAIETETNALRRFNRLYTKFIGTLNEVHLNSEFSLTEARVLYEIATRTSPTAREIAAELGLDAGYLSRLLAKFERDGLLRRTVSEQDARSAELALTTRGKTAFKKLNALSDEQARASLEALPPDRRSEVLRSMQTIERLLIRRDHARAAYVLRPHRIGDMGWIVHRESVGYAQQFGWDQQFEALIAKIAGEFLEHYDAAKERCWIAEIEGENVGHVFLMKHRSEPQTAKLRLLFVESSARGAGIGEALVNECIRFARTAGYRKIVLWTQSILTVAHRIYQKAGFRLVNEEPHHSFGHDLVGQDWELDLT